MNALVRIAALAATAAAALFFAQPSQAITPAMQPHSIIGDIANSSVTSVAYRGRGLPRAWSL